MRETVTEITCDLCLQYILGNEDDIYRIRDKDICGRCASVVKRANMFTLTTQLLKAIEEKYNSMCFVDEVDFGNVEFIQD